jgi:2,4-dienoyl-CoA reductase-like NADH-dependent reductase (Old Yellow Enzyme family)/thioredoxin reductase
MATAKYRLLEPYESGRLRLRNRIALAPMAPMMAGTDGSVTQRQIEYYGRYARGGVGLVTPEAMTMDDKEGKGIPSMLTLHSTIYITKLNELAEEVQDNGAACFAQIAHAGYQTTPENTGGRQPIAASAVPNMLTGATPRPATEEDIALIQENFVKAALNAQTARFDGVEIHGANGYLLTDFLSPRLNLRTDGYGGSFENRARLSLEIYEKIRAALDPRTIVGFRIIASEHVPDGIPVEEVIALAKLLADAGIDYLSVTSGTTETYQYGVPTGHMPRGLNLRYAAQVKKAVGDVTVSCAGGLNVEVAEQALCDGLIDIAIIGRGLIADPDLPKKLAEGRPEDIRPCIRKHCDCIGETYPGKSLRCEVNPAIAKDSKMRITPAETRKKVVVVGGGIGGLEAARVAAERGHAVIVFEKEPEAGGQYIDGCLAEFSRDSRPLLDWVLCQLDKRNVEIRLDTEATPELVSREQPDAVIVAVGSEYFVPDSLAGSTADFITPRQAMREEVPIGDRVVVVGAGFVGCETALHLATAKGKTVTIFESGDSIMPNELDPLNMLTFLGRLPESGVDIRTRTRLLDFDGTRVLGVEMDEDEVELEVDTVILTADIRSKKELAGQFEGLAPEVYLVGDCVEPRKLLFTFKDAWLAARRI